jgi:glucose dehydrogenase
MDLRWERGWAGVLAVGLLWAFTTAAAQDVLPQPPQPPVAAAPADDGQWRMPAKNYASTRYSELTKITADNVKSPKVAFTFSMGVNKGQEAAPIVTDNHDVYRGAISQHPLCARSDEGRRAD